jgi:hypothetical protein
MFLQTFQLKFLKIVNFLQFLLFSFAYFSNYIMLINVLVKGTDHHLMVIEANTLSFFLFFLREANSG